MLWSEKYRPKDLSEFVGNPSAVEEVRKWAIEWERKKAGKPIMLAGPSGVGKSCLAYALAGTLGWEVIELNASDFRDERSVEKLFLGGGASSLFGKTRLMLVDDADSMAPSEDRGGLGAVAKAASAMAMPIIVTVEDAYDRKVAALRNYCARVDLKRINSATVEKVLRRIVKEEGAKISEEQLSAIAQNASGDLRSAINDLQGGNFASAREREKNVFDSVRSVLKGDNYLEGRQAAMSLSVDHDTFKLWIGENIPNEYEKKEDVALAFDRLSRADVFDGRIYRRQYWGLMRYSNDLMTAGVALSKQEKYHKFVNYAFPSYLRSMGASKGKRAVSKSIAGKISLLCHCSLPDARWYMHVLELLCKQDVAGAKFHFGLENSEIASILGKSEDDVGRMLEEAEKNNADESDDPEKTKIIEKEKPAKKTKGAKEKLAKGGEGETGVKKAISKEAPKESAEKTEKERDASKKEKKSNGLLDYL
jgi:replication factor C large subunit